MNPTATKTATRNNLSFSIAKYLNRSASFIRNLNWNQHPSTVLIRPIHAQITSSPRRDYHDTGISRLDIRRQNVYVINRDVRRNHVNISDDWDFDSFFNLRQPEWDHRRYSLGYEEVFDEIETLLRYNNGRERFLIRFDSFCFCVFNLFFPGSGDERKQDDDNDFILRRKTMALQAGVSTSKVLILLGADSTIVTRDQGVNLIPSGNHLQRGSSSGGYASYLMPAAALGAMGCCYMWWKGLSFSDVMLLENVSEALASTKRHLSKRLENLDRKVEEQTETSKLIANDVSEMKSNLSEIGLDLDSIFQMNVTNTGRLYLCQVAGGFKDAQNIKPFQEVSAKLSDHSSLTYEDKSLKGLQFLAETNESEVIDKSLTSTKKSDLANHLIGKVPTMKTKIHRSYSVGLSLARDLI
ncbi:hypothetical protein Q3G72_025499 [Acer saccharum]|nr:hypothetical protein Q3G72_025499 [Acer saccharum]